MLAVALVAAVGLAGATASRADEGHGHGGQWHGGWYGGGHGGWHGSYWGPRIAIGIGPVGFGSGFWWGTPGYGWGWGYAPAPYPYYAAPPAVVVQQPPVYIERPEPPQAYWYYCPSAKGYYPTSPSCTEPWVKVPPRPE
jgi:hypothetical protein